MRLAGRLFVGSSLLLAATIGGLTIAADQLLRRHLEDEIASGSSPRSCQLIRSRGRKPRAGSER